MESRKGLASQIEEEGSDKALFACVGEEKQNYSLNRLY